MSNSIELTGRVKEISEKQTIKTANGDLQKRTMILILGDKYPVNYPVECIGERSDMFDLYKPNDDVKVSVNLRSYEGKDGELRTANATAWRITYINGSVPQQQKSHEDKVEEFVNQKDPLPF